MLSREVISMPVVFGLAPLFILLAVIWPIVAVLKERKEQSDYTFTASIAAWYAQIMCMIGIVVFTAGIGYLFKALIGYIDLDFSYGSMSFPILGSLVPTSVANFEQQRMVDLVVRAPSLLVGGPVIFYVHAKLSRTVTPQRMRAPYWVLRGSQLLQTAFLGTASTFSSLIALNLLLGYLFIAPLGKQSRAPFGEMLGFALAYIGAFVAHIMIWRSFPGGSWWSPPEVWPPKREKTPVVQ
jgi:hypothetical protein